MSIVKKIKDFVAVLSGAKKQSVVPVVRKMSDREYEALTRRADFLIKKYGDCRIY